MERNEQIHIRVTEDRKTDWLESVEESNEYRDLTHLIVTAVESELSGGSSESVQVRDTADVQVDLSSVHERIDDLREDINDLDSLSEDIYRIVRQDDEVIDIATYILDILPEVASEEEMRGRSAEGISGIDYVHELGLDIPLIEHCKDQGWKEFNVVRALDKLVNEMESVHRIEVTSESEEWDQQTRYFRIVE